ncbi:hypothetical protein ACOMHN_029773 [Nucella lapillus]
MPYNYTVPRGPIAAMYTSPGPSYALPGLCGHVNTPHDPRSQHNRQPAYSFGKKPPLPPLGCSPGPKYYPNPKMNRNGMDGTPQYTLHTRHAELTSFKTPGPAAYSPEKGFPSSTTPTAPAISLHRRLSDISSFKTPAPNAYRLPRVFGGATTADSTKPSCPNYTMRAKNIHGGFSEDVTKAPGPGTYDETSTSVYKHRPPVYSMLPRVFPPGDSTQKPGPGAHRPEDVSVLDVRGAQETRGGHVQRSRASLSSAQRARTPGPRPQVHLPETTRVLFRDAARSELQGLLSWTLYAGRKGTEKAGRSHVQFWSISHSPYVAPVIVDPVE